MASHSPIVIIMKSTDCQSTVFPAFFVTGVMPWLMFVLFPVFSRFDNRLVGFSYVLLPLSWTPTLLPSHCQILCNPSVQALSCTLFVSWVWPSCAFWIRTLPDNWLGLDFSRLLRGIFLSLRLNLLKNYYETCTFIPRQNHFCHNTQQVATELVHFLCSHYLEWLLCLCFLSSEITPM